MVQKNELTEKARLTHEAHVDGCSTCRAKGTPCPAAKLLRREYNNLLRAVGR